MTLETVPGQSLRLRAVLERDARFDGAFVYAVRSTGIYCRPSCPSRRPRPDNVQLFAEPVMAEQHGFRPCLRCDPAGAGQADAQAAMALAACRYLASCEPATPSLARLSAHLNIAPDRLTRAFRGVLGITPWQYADALQVERLKDELRTGGSVTDALYAAGYSSTSRVYERAGRLLGMTPRAYGAGAPGVRIAYSIAECIAGRMLVAATARGVCAVHLGTADAELEHGLRAMFPAADVQRDDATLRERVEQVAALLQAPAHPAEIPLDIWATAFQRCVWQALQRIPYGDVRTYGEIAESIGRPAAARAVGRACASNSAAIVVPCHRAIPASGGTGGYRWGTARKMALIRHERTVVETRVT